MVEFYVVGGCLKIQKSVFAQEMLRKDSLLRKLLNWRSTTDFAVEHPLVGKPDENGTITVDFSGRVLVCLGDSPKELLGNLKARYKEKIKGNVVCKGEYSMFGGLYIFEIDLNSDDGSMTYVNG